MKTYQVLLAGILSIGLLASCASDERNEPSPSKGTTTTLRISLNGAETRTSASAPITSDPSSSTTAETINNAIVAVSDGNNIISINEATISGSAGSQTATVSISSFDANKDSVLVAVNVPSDCPYKSVATRDAFHALSDGIDNALAAGDTYQESSSNLPMYGSAGKDGISSDANGYAATVNVYPLVAKITLSELDVSFASDGPLAAASFTPTEVFLYQVPGNLYYNYASPWQGTAIYQGETGITTNYKAYLTTGNLASATKLSGTTGTEEFDGTNKTLYFYTMPNNTFTTNATDTRLIIKGKFSPSGGDKTASDAVDVYYPISINHAGPNGTTNGGNNQCVYPDRNYILKVTIKGRGNDGVSDPVDPQSLSATLNVESFTDVSQTNEFD